MVAITFLADFSGNLDAYFALLRGDMRHSVQNTQSQEQQRQKMVASMAEKTAILEERSVQTCDGKGVCAPVDAAMAVEMDLKSTVQTVGANGAINVMGDKLKLLAQQLLVSNQITPEQAGIFNDLANQGYRIGQISGMIEQTAKECGSDMACFNNKTVLFEGQPQSMQQLSDMIGYRPLGGDESNTADNPEVASLWGIYKSLPVEVWNNPEVKGTVTTLTTQIGQTSNLVMWGTSNIKNGYMGPDGLNSYLVQEAQGSIPQSDLAGGGSARGSIDGDSGNICVSGSGTVSGAHCQ